MGTKISFKYSPGAGVQLLVVLCPCVDKSNDPLDGCPVYTISPLIGQGTREGALVVIIVCVMD